MSATLRAAIGAGMLLLAAARADAAAPDLSGFAVEEALGGPPLVAEALADGAAPPVPVVVHLVIDAADLTAPASSDFLARLDARVSLYRERGIPVVLVLGAVPADEPAVEAWRSALRAVVTRERGRLAGYQLGTVAAAAMPAAPPYAFALKQAAVFIRSVDADVRVIAGAVPAGSADWLERVFAEGVAPYVDAVAVAGDDGADGEAFRAAADAVRALLSREDPTAAIWLGPIATAEAAPAAVEDFLGSALRSRGEAGLTVFRISAPAFRAALGRAAEMSDVLAGDVLSLDSSQVRWSRDGASTTVPSRLLYSLSNGNTYLVYGGVADAGRAQVEIDVAMSAPAVRDPFTGEVDRLPAPAADPAQPSRVTVPLAAHPLVLDLNFGQAVYSSATEVRETAAPAVEEIIARYQEVQAAQDALVRNYTAGLRIDMRFHPTPADPAYHVVTENRLFADAGGLEWVEDSFSLNGATWRTNRPSFPLLQPEKVLSLPLDLRLNQDYRYRLEGLERVGEREAFAVQFDPVDPSRSLYRGTVWIDRATFARLKVSAIQTRGSGVVQANEEEQTFGQVGEIDGRPIRLMTHLTSRQTFLVAGRTVLNERDVSLTNVSLNVPAFAAARAAARTSDRVMYRDTDEGVRYFVKKGETRVVSEDLTTSARALAMGVDIDPSLEYPLPIAGIDILDFNFLNRDMQLALLFGGVIALGNVQRSGLWNGRIDASVDFFGLAVKTNDLVFDQAGERRDERVLTAPLSSAINLGLRLSPSHKISGRIEVRHDAYSRAGDAAADFVAPASTATVGEELGYEYRRHGYSFRAAAGTYRRSRWTPWGDLAAFDPATRTYVRYDAGVSKDFVFRTFHTVHLNAQYFGGRRLDRFSMYQFGMFDAARMHGVPAAVRFDRLAMFRGSYSFNLFDQYRLDLFADQAVGRAGTIDERWRPVTGLGVAVNFRGWRSTIVRMDLGHSWLPAFYRGAGATVAQILILKPL